MFIKALFGVLKTHLMHEYHDHYSYCTGYIEVLYKYQNIVRALPIRDGRKNCKTCHLVEPIRILI